MCSSFGVDLVPVDIIWRFSINEIARQIDKLPGEMLLPNRATVERTFFAKVDEVCAAGVKYEQQSPLKKQIDEH